MENDVILQSRDLNKRKPFPWRKQLTLFLIGWLGLKILSNIVIAITLLVNVPAKQAFDYLINSNASQAVYDLLSNDYTSMQINSIVYLLTFACLVGLINLDTPELAKTFKKPKAYGFAILGLLIMFGFNYLYGIITSGIESNQNEQALDQIIPLFPVMSIIIFGLVGPACEEITYRVGLFSLIKRKNKELAYILTALIFALIHFSFDSILVAISGSGTTFLVNELLNIPTYLFAGLVFCSLYDKYGFAASFTAHALNNLISIVLTIVISRLA